MTSKGHHWPYIGHLSDPICPNLRRAATATRPSQDAGLSLADAFRRMSKTLRILHLEDSAADVERIKAELTRAGMKILSERVSSGDRFTSALREFQPDVVLCDHAQATFDALAALAALQTYHPTAPLILVSAVVDEQTAVASVRAGAEDIVLKRNLGRLSSAIEAALAVRRRLRKLTPRQLEVLRLVAAGHTTREIARRLKLSAKTVESHRGEVMKRLAMHDVVALVRYAVRVGLVPPEF
jgi:DNA-binding NarL/FixJ family response regulator